MKRFFLMCVGLYIWTVASLQAGAAVDGNGTYEVALVHEKGNCALQVDWVALCEDGQEIARDSHNAESGTFKTGTFMVDNVYTFNVEEYKPDSTYTLKACIQTVNRTNSAGSIKVRKRVPSEVKRDVE